MNDIFDVDELRHGSTCGTSLSLPIALKVLLDNRAQQIKVTRSAIVIEALVAYFTKLTQPNTIVLCDNSVEQISEE